MMAPMTSSRDANADPQSQGDAWEAAAFHGCADWHVCLFGRFVPHQRTAPLPVTRIPLSPAPLQCPTESPGGDAAVLVRRAGCVLVSH